MDAASPTLKRLHELKEEFRSIFETAPDPTTAAQRLQEWITAVEQSGLKSLMPFLTTLRNWWDAILDYFNEPITSGLVEGLNNKIKPVLVSGQGSSSAWLMAIATSTTSAYACWLNAMGQPEHTIPQRAIMICGDLTSTTL